MMIIDIIHNIAGEINGGIMDISYSFSSNPTKFIPPQIELNQ